MSPAVASVHYNQTIKLFAQSFSKRVPKDSIRLSNVPYSANLNDVRTALSRSSVIGVVDVAREYFRWVPTNNIVVTLKSYDDAQTALSSLQKLTIGGENIIPSFADRSLDTERIQEASSNAGKLGLPGTGLHGGTPLRSSSVIVGGLPTNLPNGDSAELSDLVRNVSAIFSDFTLRTNSSGFPIEYVTRSKGYVPANSRSFLVHFNSPQEAYRAVRKFHRTHFMPQKYGEEFPLTARIIH